MNPARMRHAGIAVGSQVPVELSPEGRSALLILPRTLPPRWTAAPPPARSSTRSRSSTAMANLRYIDATKRRPDLRAARIAEVHGAARKRAQGTAAFVT